MGTLRVQTARRWYPSHRDTCSKRDASTTSSQQQFQVQPTCQVDRTTCLPDGVHLPGGLHLNKIGGNNLLCTDRIPPEPASYRLFRGLVLGGEAFVIGGAALAVSGMPFPHKTSGKPRLIPERPEQSLVGVGLRL